MKDTFYLNISTVADRLGIGLFKYSLSRPEGFTIINSKLAKILGYSSKNKLKNRKLDKLFLKPKDKERFWKSLHSKRRVKFFETIFRSKGNKARWVAITASCVTDTDKKEYLEGIIEDISSHKELEEALALERDFMQGLLDNIPDAIYFKDRRNRIIKVNKFYARGFKMKPDDIIGKTDFHFFPRKQAKKMFADDNYVLKSGKPILGKIERTLLPNGTWNQAITTKIPMHDRSGKIIGTMGITRDMTAYANLEKERLNMAINALSALVKALEMRDPYTFSHVRHVSSIAEKIAEELGWDENHILSMSLAGELHDVGKISIPLDILNKPGKLNDLEYQLIQKHVQNCYNLIKDIKFPFSVAQFIYQHHERLDGSGYPQGIKEDQILPESRILAVSDVLESMTYHRPYRQALGINKAMQELENGAGIKYDAGVVKAVRKLLKNNDGKIFWENN
jgi:PAS domain S-box-containing protein/putative nucleotidyltransferase with HDIG domain